MRPSDERCSVNGEQRTCATCPGRDVLFDALQAVRNAGSADTLYDAVFVAGRRVADVMLPQFRGWRPHRQR